MKKFPLFIVATTDQSAEISRALKKGLVRKIGPRLYTSNTADTPEQLVRQNCWQIISLLMPGAVVSNRSALENRISPAGRIYVTATDYTRTINLPDLEVVVLKGLGPIPERDMPMFNIYLSCRERAFLENLSATKNRGGESKNLSRLELEERLLQVYDNSGAAALNALRDKAREIAPVLGLEAEFQKLDDIIGAIQGTREAQALASPQSFARSVGEGYDPKAVERFAILRAALLDRSFRPRPMPAGDQKFYNVAFFDAYFSNFIEGTEFEVEEAREIIESGMVPADRPADGHDVLGTYRVVAGVDDMMTIPTDFEHFIHILTTRHSLILEGRPDKQPGRFKEKPNVAGMTRFVEPALVKGTLRQGYEFYRGIEEPFARALAIFFIISDVHPFNDGNGRLARAMMNSELVAKGETRIFIPSVFRSEYLAGVKRMTRDSDPTAYIKQHEYLQEFVTRIDFADMNRAIDVLRRCNAFAKPEDAVKLQMPAG